MALDTLSSRYPRSDERAFSDWAVKDVVGRVVESRVDAEARRGGSAARLAVGFGGRLEVQEAVTYSFRQSNVGHFYPLLGYRLRDASS